MKDNMENEKPLISIIVPVYNCKHSIQRCIESIKVQSYKNIEIIITDDGATDGTGELCDELKATDKRIIVIHQSNQGVSEARNSAINSSRGDYISFVDADDCIAKNYVLDLYELITSGDYDIAMTGFERCKSPIENKKGRDNAFCRKRSISQTEFKKKLLKVNTQKSYQYVWSKLYKREVIVGVQFPKGIRNGEDLFFNYEVAMKVKNVVEADIGNYYYLINPNSATKEVMNDAQFDFMKVCHRIYRLSVDTNDTEILRYAYIFKCRADFTVLCKIAMYDSEQSSKYKKTEAKLLGRLKQNKKLLMKSSIPYSRKFLIFMMCTNYCVTSNIMRHGYILSKSIFRNYR